MQDTNSSHQTSVSGEGSPAARPDLQTALLIVAQAAQVYYDRYAQDEADDGDYLRNCDSDMSGQNTGCSWQQGIDALALRTALQLLRKAKDAK